MKSNSFKIVNIIVLSLLLLFASTVCVMAETQTDEAPASTDEVVLDDNSGAVTNPSVEETVESTEPASEPAGEPVQGESIPDVSVEEETFEQTEQPAAASVDPAPASTETENNGAEASTEEGEEEEVLVEPDLSDEGSEEEAVLGPASSYAPTSFGGRETVYFPDGRVDVTNYYRTASSGYNGGGGRYSSNNRNYSGNYTYAAAPNTIINSYGLSCFNACFVGFRRLSYLEALRKES